MPLLHYQKLVNSLFAICSEPAKICNITGTFYHARTGSTGVFSVSFSTNSCVMEQQQFGQYLQFDASTVSDIYSNDTDSLNPDSITCKFAIKY